MSKKPSKPASSPNPSFRGFLNVNLTDEDKATVKSTAYDGAAWSSDLDKWCDSGFKFTFSYDDFRRSFMCIGARTDKMHEDYGILMTGHGSTAIKAFKQWVYIQTRILNGGSWTLAMDKREPDEIDD